VKVVFGNHIFARGCPTITPVLMLNNDDLVMCQCPSNG